MSTLNWKLIFGLSLIGLAMAFLTTYMIPSSIEMILWPVIILINAFLIAKFAPGKYFLHGFMAALTNSVWITSVHILLFNDYLAHHPDWVAKLPEMPWPTHPRWFALIMGPAIGIGTGLVNGLFALLAAKLMKKK